MSENPVKSLKALYRLLYDKYIPYYIQVCSTRFRPNWPILVFLNDEIGMKKKEKPPYWQNHFYEKESYPPKKHKKRKNRFTKTPKSYISIKKTLFFAFYFIFL